MTWRMNVAHWFERLFADEQKRQPAERKRCPGCGRLVAHTKAGRAYKHICDSRSAEPRQTGGES